MTFDQYLKEDYKALMEAADKITGRNELAIDLLHYAIEEMSHKQNLQAIVDSGGARFYCVCIMSTQWRSATGPFYKQFVRQHDDIDNYDSPIETEEHFDYTKMNDLLEQINWYDRELFKLFADGRHTYSSLSRETGIPRTSISLTINRVRKFLKKHI